MARSWARFEADVNALISHITGFDEYEENFRLCLQFAQSNLLHHQFLSVDSHRITRTIKGLEEKFAVHSDDKKAKAFKDYTNAFLQTPAFENRDTGKTDTHYALLSFLANVADAPTHAKYKLRKLKKQQVEDDFDWAGYLMEGEEWFSGPYPPTPEWSEDEDEEESSMTQQPPCIPRSAWSPGRLPGALEDQHDPVMMRTSTPHQDDEEWLSRNIITQYWDSSAVSNINQSHSRETTLSADWMVSGMKKTFIFQLNDGKYFVRQGIETPHLTREALHNILSEATHYGNIVLQLSLFIEKVTSSLCRYDNQGRPDMTSCQTYQAFAGVLSKVIQEFRDQLMILEKEISQQEKPTTLLCVMERLRKWCPQLNLLNQVYEEGIVAVYEKTNVERASHLLSFLYAILVDLDTLGQDISLVVLFLRLWSAASRPYWDIIDQWISQGKLSDPYREFLIQRNESVTSLDEEFWNTAFTLYTPTISPDKAMPAEQHSYPTQPTSRSRLNRKTSEKDDSNLDSTLLYETSLAPEFLQPVLRHIILAGKSMEMLQALGHLANIVDDHQKKGGIRDTLYESFIKSLQKNTGKSTSTHDECEEDQPDEQVRRPVHPEQMRAQINIKGTFDPLLRHNFSAIFDHDLFYCTLLTDREDNLEKLLLSLDMSHGMPIHLLLEKCLYPNIIERYKLVCRHLLNILKSDYHLHDYFTAMRAFFLMEAGDTMYDFYTELFEKLRLREPWQDMTFLNLSLQEGLTAHFPKHADNLYVSITEVIADPSMPEDPVSRKIRDRQPINALDDLKMHYKTPWPINVVLNTHSFKVYNAIFSFLLQIKRSKYCLDHLRFYDLQRKREIEEKLTAETFNLHAAQQSAQHAATRGDRIHRMQLFRMKLMHFINSLHNYIMTRILHSTGLEFQEALAEAQDLDDVIRLHATYVSHLHERCLLHHMVRFLKVAITKVMNLALTLQVCWDEGVDSVSEKHLAGMETEFSRCIQFLGSFLTNVVKHGLHPHLAEGGHADGLAMSVAFVQFLLRQFADLDRFNAFKELEATLRPEGGIASLRTFIIKWQNARG